MPKRFAPGVPRFTAQYSSTKMPMTVNAISTHQPFRLISCNRRINGRAGKKVMSSKMPFNGDPVASGKSAW